MAYMNRYIYPHYKDEKTEEETQNPWLVKSMEIQPSLPVKPHSHAASYREIALLLSPADPCQHSDFTL